MFCFDFVLSLLMSCDDTRLRLKTKDNFFCFLSKCSITLKQNFLKLSQITSLENKMIRLLRSLLSYKTCTQIFSIFYLVNRLSYRYVNLEG